MHLVEQRVDIRMVSMTEGRKKDQPDEKVRSGRSFLNKNFLLCMLAVCTYEIFLSIRSLKLVAQPAHDWILIGGLLFTAWIVVVCAFRTKAIKERLFFAFISIAVLLYLTLAISLPSQQIMH